MLVTGGPKSDIFTALTWSYILQEYKFLAFFFTLSTLLHWKKVTDYWTERKDVRARTNYIESQCAWELQGFSAACRWSVSPRAPTNASLTQFLLAINGKIWGVVTKKFWTHFGSFNYSVCSDSGSTLVVYIYSSFLPPLYVRETHYFFYIMVNVKISLWRILSLVYDKYDVLRKNVKLW